MRISLLLIYFFIAIVFTACTHANGKQTPVYNPSYPIHIKTGEDDDQPIYIQVTRKGNGLPASGVSVTLVNVSDTISSLTDWNGHASFDSLDFGQYYLAIESPLYQNVYDVITISAPQTIRIDTLDTQ